MAVLKFADVGAVARGTERIYAIYKGQELLWDTGWVVTDPSLESFSWQDFHRTGATAYAEWTYSPCPANISEYSVIILQKNLTLNTPYVKWFEGSGSQLGPCHEWTSLSDHIPASGQTIEVTGQVVWRQYVSPNYVFHYGPVSTIQYTWP